MLIDRDKAILKCQERLYESALNNVGAECKADEVFSDIAQNRIKDWLEEVPSAEPNVLDDGTLTITVPHGMLSKVNRVIVDEVGTKFCKMMYQDALPSAEPQIIRCKDCVHWKHSNIRPNYCDIWEWCNQADDFCSFAERREEE